MPEFESSYFSAELYIEAIILYISERLKEQYLYFVFSTVPNKTAVKKEKFGSVFQTDAFVMLISWTVTVWILIVIAFCSSDKYLTKKIRPGKTAGIFIRSRSFSTITQERYLQE